MNIYYDNNKVIAINEELKIFIRTNYDEKQTEYIVKNKDKINVIKMINMSDNSKYKLICNLNYLILFNIGDDKLVNITDIFDIKNMVEVYPKSYYNENVGFDIIKIYNDVLRDYNYIQETHLKQTEEYINDFNKKVLKKRIEHSIFE